MGVFLSLLKKELRTCFYSPIAYVVMFFFWILTGGNFYWLLINLAHGESLTSASQWMFSGFVLPFAIPVIVPLITMRLFAEERKLGTLEALLTTSVKVTELVLAKFFGAFIFYVVLWLPAIAYTCFQIKLAPAEVTGFPDLGALQAGVLGVMLVGALYIAIGLFMSTLTSNQIVAAISGFAILIGSLFVSMYMAYTAQSQSIRIVGQYYSSFAHMMEFSRGIVDSRVVVMYLGHAAWFLFAAVRVVEGRRV
ncbi:ABC transporter permease [Pontiella agarivorans]|uniref:ABC transporter permease n=1 Tax=Pontiella agarivorans TaxID=3038953 RepID=A0ABU5MUQ8_9BACT|nr:ABC transporter permease [Pontiella agarivorans]MDZ8117892.1 ABC transporter permease [Pontiella agarivorans]